ncbi:alpha-L-fucosidase [Arthrobacter sp. H35-D1]|uniref:alpha-L-fucosidase n=1 Tax=Arthrobacter sp. H35-D1 TaxID=3046202 RepID=UPI0024B99305|nr:alpha-L-fucosidase [Arthrobacter sp. H35-D1]MDJ0314462.1 alpha-L-fucosidase [Arthrobacter sp. H35-D1]
MPSTLPAKSSKSAFVAPTADEGVHGPSVVRQTPEDIARRELWSESSFGVFVHWGVSAILGGLWHGKHVEGLAEWIQFRAKIPLAEYAELAKDFNPADLNARDWVRMAAEAGAKYFVYTAKHHDGFAMYHSQASAYNVVDATPFQRDPLAEIAQACVEYGIMLGVYYSQTIDWEDPDAVGPSCNSWDFDTEKGDFHSYWRRKAAPQLREILSNYGDIGLMWFDMPSGIPAECAQEAFSLVRELQPGAVINSRLGGGVDADYNSMDDNYFNNFLPVNAWETAATTNDSWGFSKLAAGWKPVASLCETLAYTVSRGGNLLLNAGPDASGAIPEKVQEQFAGIGTWMQRAVSAIRGAGPSPFAASFDWGYVTAGESSVYLHVADLGKQELSLRGIASAPDSVRDLGTGTLLPFTLSEADGRGPLLTLELAAPTDELPRTIELAFTELPRVDQSIVQVPGSPLRLDVWNAETGAGEALRWNFTMATPGEYRVVLLSKETFGNFNPQWWADGLTGTLETEAGSTPFTLRRDGEELYPILHYWKVVRSEIGVLHVSRTGQHKLNIEDLPVVDSKWDRGGVNMIALRLEPVASED